MKRIFVLISIFSIICIAANVCYSAQYWAKTYAKYDTLFSSIQQTADGGFIVAGRSEARSAGDAFVLKLDVTGRFLWQKTYGERYSEEFAKSIQQTADGGYIVAGNMWGGSWILKLDGIGDINWQKRIYSDVSRGGTASYIQQTMDSGYIVRMGNYIFKLNGNGDINWQKFYGVNSSGSPEPIRQTTDGGYIVCGYREIYDDGHTWIESMWIMKIDGSGNITWQKEYGECVYYNRAHSIQQTADGGYIVAGVSNCNPPPDFHVMKLDSNGNITWQKIYGDNYDAVGYSIQQTTDGGYILAGYIQTEFTKKDCLILKLDNNGNITWQKTYGLADKSETAHSVKQTYDGGYIVGVGVEGSGKILLLKLDSNGDIPDCNIIENSNVFTYAWSGSVQDATVAYQLTSFKAEDTQLAYQAEQTYMHTICPWIDSDGDSIHDDEDNCPNTANGSNLGTCTGGSIKSTCLSDDECGTDGVCSLYQEDADGDGVGDVCETCLTESIYGEHSGEAEILRDFRDNVLTQTPAGQEIIELYYQWSPVMVKAMEADEAYKEEVKEMIDGVLELIGGGME